MEEVKQLTILAVAFLMCHAVMCHNFRSSYVKHFESCALGEVSTQSVTLSKSLCSYKCLEDMYSARCAAYQWDADTKTCSLQETLNLVTSNSSSSFEDSVGVMLKTKDQMDAGAECVDDTDCPANYNCVNTDTGCGIQSSFCAAADCAVIQASDPDSTSGVYRIHAGTQNSHEVWCDMDTDGGGWTVFLKRLDGSVDFYQDLAAYKHGFGVVSGEFWLGLDVLHALTSLKTYKLRADVSNWAGSSVHAIHPSMVVAGEADNYRLAIGAFVSGSAGNALDLFNNMEFTTKDFDRDQFSDVTVNCADRHHGGFWYNNCLIANPTGKYYTGGAYSSSNNNDGIQWRSWNIHDDRYYSMKTIELKLRP